jgi:hypothetical protein
LVLEAGPTEYRPSVGHHVLGFWKEWMKSWLVEPPGLSPPEKDQGGDYFAGKGATNMEK